MLAPLGREALREVIEQPAKVARLRLDEGLATQLVADTDSGEAMPLLAFILRQLADGLPSEARWLCPGTTTLAVSAALIQHADAAFEVWEPPIAHYAVDFGVIRPRSVDRLDDDSCSPLQLRP